MTFSDQLYGCFLGKTIGGTLGACHEGRNGYLQLTGYNPQPAGAMPNDDLDLQLVWLDCLKKSRLQITPQTLADGWLRHIDFHADEYGVAIANLKKGIMPPLSGLHNNFFVDGIGGAIRCEIWSCVAAGRPQTAAAWAELDASVDHYGNGVTGSVFFALLESDLFCSGNLRRSIDFAYQNIPGGKFKSMVAEALQLFETGQSYETARDVLTQRFWSDNFSDICLNGAYIMLGLLYGGGNFKQSVLAAVNCGQDTDCTGATTGAIMGILLGRDRIEPELAGPVGNAIVVGDYIKNLDYPATLEQLVEDIGLLHSQLAADAPRLALPYRPVEVTDYSDQVSWQVNGIAAKLPGLILDLQTLSDDPYREITLQSTVTSAVDQSIYLMLCAKGLNSIFVDDVKVAQFGNFGAMIPGFHRVTGGILTQIEFKAGVPRRLQLGIFTHKLQIEPKAYYGFCDDNFRHCNNLTFA